MLRIYHPWGIARAPQRATSATSRQHGNLGTTWPTPLDPCDKGTDLATSNLRSGDKSETTPNDVRENNIAANRNTNAAALRIIIDSPSYIMLMAFLKNLSYNKNIVYSRSILAEPHLIIFHFILYNLY
jgi:hypothetical protein